MNTITKKKALNKADELGKKSTEKDVIDLDSKLPSMKKGVIVKIWDKVLFLWEQAKSPDVPLRLKLVIVGALLYLVLPIDVMPDTIPGVGLLDDLSVLLTVFREVSKYALPKLEKKIENTIKNTKRTKIVIQSQMGGEITPDEILAKIGEADTVYIRVDQNKAYWVKGKETGSVDLW